MHLTSHSDYALRILLVLGASYPELSTIREIGQAFDISEHHLAKVVQTLAQAKIVETIRGKDGGMRLAVSPDKINLGHVLRHTESDFGVVPCLKNGGTECFISPVCGLKSVLAEATQHFIRHLEQYHLSDFIRKDRAFPPDKKADLESVLSRRLPRFKP